MRLGVITDIHANLPALHAALDAMQADGCEHIVHTGDAIGIGPHPREVMMVLQEQPHMSLIRGNHDDLFAFGLPTPLPIWMSAGEAAHQRWTHDQINDSSRDWVRDWPLAIDQEYGCATVRFQHYAIAGDGFAPVSITNDPHELDEMFRPTTDIVFFGHHHPRADVRGKARYINPGALGCQPSLGARYALLEIGDTGQTTVSLRSVPYDATSVCADMLEREVPEADFILRTFLQ